MSNFEGKSKNTVKIITVAVAVVIAVVAIIAAVGSKKSDNPTDNASYTSAATTDNAESSTDSSSTDASSTEVSSTEKSSEDKKSSTKTSSSAISKSEMIKLYCSFIKENMPDATFCMYDLDNNGRVELIRSDTKYDSTSMYSVYEIVDGVVTMRDKIHLGYSSGLWINTKTKDVATINYDDPSDDPFFDYMNPPEFVESDTEIISYRKGKISRKSGKTVKVPYATGFYVDDYMQIFSFQGADFDTISMIVNDGYDAYYEYYLEHFAVF